MIALVLFACVGAALAQADEIAAALARVPPLKVLSFTPAEQRNSEFTLRNSEAITGALRGRHAAASPISPPTNFLFLFLFLFLFAFSFFLFLLLNCILQWCSIARWWRSARRGAGR